MRRLFAWIPLSCAIAVLGSSSPLRDEPDFGERPIALRLIAVPLKGLLTGPGLRAVGAWQLTSNDKGFGAVSALAIDRGRMIMIADTGSVIEVRPRFAARRATGTIAGVARSCGYDGQKTSRDSESIAIDPKGGIRWIGFEYRNLICRIDPRNPEAASTANPRAMREWPKTGGPESMTRLSDGRFVVIAERPRSGGRESPLLIFDRDPVDPAAKASVARFVPPQDHRPTEVAALPDGSLLVLLRHYRPPFGFDGRLVRVSVAEQSKPKLSGRTIARFTAPLDENFEALAVTEAGGRTYVWAMSDDNFMPFQRTILVLFELTGWSGQSSPS